MAPIPIPLQWRRRALAVLEPAGLPRKYRGLAVQALVAGPFAIYTGDWRWGYTLIHLPSQTLIFELPKQADCRAAAERLAGLDINWWTCITAEVKGPDTPELRKIYDELMVSPVVERRRART
jgi:hypothetical protein